MPRDSEECCECESTKALLRILSGELQDEVSRLGIVRAIVPAGPKETVCIGVSVWDLVTLDSPEKIATIAARMELRS